ncbi:MAG TPA: ATP-dependent DNA helicase RecQ, partial [Leptospiraceae bacterium]|nr:ATP-dependent DNA helicase RecQ [Leptospiraceae bacterium]
MQRAAFAALAPFGLSEFRPGQLEAIEGILSGKDVMVILPTGGGKSLIYQLPAVMRETGLTLVISPLIALMKDQADSMRAIGVAAEYCNSTQDELEQRRVLSHCVTGKVKILYVSPERALSGDFLAILPRMNVNLIAVDEAHCISQWGHDFRPEYRALHNLRISGVPVVALTATATARVTRDVISSLDLHDPEIIKKSFFRPNLHYRVLHPENDREKQRILLDLLEERKFRENAPGKCIIYCATRKKVDQVFEFLGSYGFRVGRYHAGRTSAGREKMQDAYSAGKVNVLVATNAFGMGMDALDVRLVLHYQVPSSLDAYYQESGRAGRDGQVSDCILFFSNADFVTQSFILGRSAGEDLLAPVRDFGYSQMCRQQYICSYFGEEISSCGVCDCCLEDGSASREDFLERERKSQTHRDARASYEFSDSEIESVHAVLRDYPGKFGKKILAGVLRGSKARDIIRYRLTQSSAYGALKDVPEEAIIRFFQDGIDNGIIKIEGIKYPKIYLAQEPPRARVRKESPRKSGPTEASDLLKKLKSFRDREARRLKWKKYMVMQNGLLSRIALSRPSSFAELARIKGMGDSRAEKYGPEIL